MRHEPITISDDSDEDSGKVRKRSAGPSKTASGMKETHEWLFSE